MIECQKISHFILIIISNHCFMTKSNKKVEKGLEANEKLMKLPGSYGKLLKSLRKLFLTQVKLG